MTITFDVSEQDLWNFQRHFMANSRAYRRMNSVTAVVAPAMVIALLVINYRNEPEMLMVAIPISLPVMAILFGIFYFFFRWQARAMFRRAVREGQSKGVLGPHTITLEPDTLREVTAAGEATHKWSGIAKVAETDDYIFVYTQPFAAHVIPRRAFATSADAASFANRARELHDAAKAATTAR